MRMRMRESKQASKQASDKEREQDKETEDAPVLCICFFQLLLKLDPVYESFEIPYVVVQHHQHLLKIRMIMKGL